MRTLLVLCCSASLLACSSAPADPAGSPPDALLAEGQGLLHAGRAREAEALFAQAAALDDDPLRSRLWLLRSWMDQGRSNETLDAIDALVREGAEGPAIDYLYGMAFTRRAQDKLAQGAVDSSVQMNFEDAVGLLQSAVEAEPERFADGWPALAYSAWMSLDLPLAREAAERAVAVRPESPEDRALLGRIAFSQFRAAYDAAGDWSPEAEADWQRASAAFREAIALFGTADREGERFLLSDAQVQLANACLWKEDTRAAVDAYAEAIGWAPDAVDYAQVRPLFQPADFRTALEDGLALAERRFASAAPDDQAAPQGPNDAALLWWLGYARYAAGASAEAEEAFLRALDKEPSYANAWFYVALSRYAREDWGGTADALRAAWDADAPAVVAEMQTDLELNLAKLSYVVAWSVDQQRLADAALLSRINAESALDVATYWNDLGLFLRDLGEEQEVRSDALALYEEAYEAYRRALALAPDDPQILNDTAVMLHYYLGRDLDRALSMYARAKQLAREQLDSGEVPEELLPILETALRDATDNLGRLEAMLAEKAG